MTTQELDNWYCSLSVKQKEHIACKILLKQGKAPDQGLYPNCVNIWNTMDEERKNAIHDHCTDKHGMWIQEGGDGTIYSF